MKVSKKVKRKFWVYICVIAGIIVLVVLVVCGYHKPQENIFFLEYESEYEKEDTIIYQYNSKNKTVVEVGRVQGELQDCVINSEETYITGLVFAEKVEIVRYDLVTGTVETLDAARKIDTLTGNTAAWYGGSLIYDGGNKIFISFEDENGDEKWLLYDLVTDQYDIVKGENGTIWYLEIYDNSLWYIAADWTLCKYDLGRKERTKIMESAHYNSVVMPEMNLVAYTKDIHREEIYLYDTTTQNSSCIAKRWWNTVYGDFLWTNARRSDNGRELFYIKYYPGLFNAATTKLMIYDVITHRSRCIYKVKMTTHEFRYVMKR